MDDKISKDILANYKDFLLSAEEDLEKERYNPAMSSYFKAIAILCDYYVYKYRRVLPKNHKERFMFLQLHFREAYDLISPLFKEYTDSYNMRIKRENVLKLKENVEKLKYIFKIEE